jgi:polyisoprenoid-binding protein YceI
MERHNRFRPSLLGGAVLLALATFSLVAAAKLGSVSGTSAGFHATGPAGLSIDGNTSDVAVADDGTTVTITVQLGNLKTGSDLRDKHTKEDLEADKFPTAVLKVPRSGLQMGGGSGDTKGTLTIHGTTKDVSFHYDAKKNGDTLSVSGSATISVSGFGVKPRSYLGISIKDNVDVKASFSAKDS